MVPSRTLPCWISTAQYLLTFLPLSAPGLILNPLNGFLAFPSPLKMFVSLAFLVQFYGQEKNAGK